MSDDDRLVTELLDRFERQEERLLAWGLVDGGFSEEEVRHIASQVLDDSKSSLSQEELIEVALQRKLVFPFHDGARRIYRSRMAEGVRLLLRLKQLFPGRPWRLAPTLVADFRFARKPRRYPRRQLGRVDVEDTLSQFAMSAARKRFLHALLRTGSAEELQLAQFQLDALRQMISDFNGRSSRGMIIGAGTGTGKTLAFYIPALMHLAEWVQKNSWWTKAIAIYPRNELLKDQFAEVYDEARRLDEALLKDGARKLVIGAFFGPTPRRASDLVDYGTWERKGDGFVCPFIRCPRCESELIWRESDVTRREERLVCAGSDCGLSIGPDEIILTRDRMAKTPPDVLFTTTEMLNRQIGNSQYGGVFGLGVSRRPRLMLLDEVHTYSGTSGAQVALLLRRYQHAMGGRLHFTGLSATLPGAANFFAQLTGLKPGAIEEISPRDADLDLVPESHEYLVALRGDPVSVTSLLSTSIQTAMLLRRLLDPEALEPSEGRFGKRVFVFTDDLDVTNRLYNNLQDAEALNSWSQPLAGRRPLAALRAAGQPEARERWLAGQSWQVSEDIGHPTGLVQPVIVSRTTS